MPAASLRRGRRGDLPFIRAKAKQWRLDDEALSAGGFVVAQDGRGRIVGFGRIKPYSSCFELGTVGVSPSWRGRGVGREIVARLIERFPSRNVWITTDLTAYFRRLGFKVRRRGPLELMEKISNVCRVKGRRGVRIMLLRKDHGSKG